MPEDDYEGYYPPQMMRRNENDAALVERLDPSKILENISHFLKGEIYNFEEDKWESKLVPLCNNLGHNRIMLCAATIINQNTTLSELEDDDIGKICYYLGLRIINLLFLEHENFEIRKENLDIIWENICDAAFLSLKRARKRGEMKSIRHAVSSQEHIMVQGKPNAEKKRFFIFGGNK